MHNYMELNCHSNMIFPMTHFISFLITSVGTSFSENLCLFIILYSTENRLYFNHFQLADGTGYFSEFDIRSILNLLVKP